MLTTAASDFGTITILWSQPVTALQILSHDGKWRWVKHIDNALVSSSTLSSIPPALRDLT